MKISNQEKGIRCSAVLPVPHKCLRPHLPKITAFLAVVWIWIRKNPDLVPDPINWFRSGAERTRLQILCNSNRCLSLRELQSQENNYTMVKALILRKFENIWFDPDRNLDLNLNGH